MLPIKEKIKFIGLSSPTSKKEEDDDDDNYNKKIKNTNIRIRK
jgi:hypothetical protein